MKPLKIRSLLKVFFSQFGTVCEELRDRKFIKASDYKALLRFERDIPMSFCVAYRIIITPVVMLMRVFPVILPLVNRIARYVFIDMAIREGKKLLEEDK